MHVDMLPADRKRARALKNMTFLVRLHPDPKLQGWLQVKRDRCADGASGWLTCPLPVSPCGVYIYGIFCIGIMML